MFRIAEQLGFLCHHILLGGAKALALAVKFRLPPLAERALCHTSVLRGLMSPKEAVLLLFPGKLLFSELRPRVLRRAVRVSSREAKGPPLKVHCPILIVPPAGPGEGLREARTVCFPLLFAERLKPGYKAVQVIFAAAHAKSETVALIFGIGEPRRRHISRRF